MSDRLPSNGEQIVILGVAAACALAAAGASLWFSSSRDRIRKVAAKPSQLDKTELVDVLAALASAAEEVKASVLTDFDAKYQHARAVAQASRGRSQVRMPGMSQAIAMFNERMAAAEARVLAEKVVEKKNVEAALAFFTSRRSKEVGAAEAAILQHGITEAVSGQVAADYMVDLLKFAVEAVRDVMSEGSGMPGLELTSEEGLPVAMERMRTRVRGANKALYKARGWTKTEMPPSFLNSCLQHYASDLAEDSRVSTAMAQLRFAASSTGFLPDAAEALINCDWS